MMQMFFDFFVKGCIPQKRPPHKDFLYCYLCAGLIGETWVDYHAMSIIVHVHVGCFPKAFDK